MRIDGFLPALIGAAVLAVLSVLAIVRSVLGLVTGVLRRD